MGVEGLIFIMIVACIIYWLTQPRIMEPFFKRQKDLNRKMFPGMEDINPLPGDPEFLWSISEMCRIQRAIYLSLIGTILICNMFEYPDNLALGVIIFPIIFYLFWVLLKYFDERKDKAKQP